MGNDNKIAPEKKLPAAKKTQELADSHKSEVRLFLDDELKPLANAKPVTYNLEKEYAKTAKNKSPFIPILFAVCIIVVGAVTFGISKYVDYKNSKITVNINAFDDLNLRNLLDIVSQTQSNYDEAIRVKSELEAELAYKLEKAKQKKEADLFAVESLKLSNVREKNNRINTITLDYQSEILALKEEYSVKIATQDNLASKYQQQLAEFDSGKVEQAKAQDAAVDSQKRLFEMEKAKMLEAQEREMESLRRQLSANQQEAMEWQMQTVNDISKKYQDEIDALDPIIKGQDNLLLKGKLSESNSAYDTAMLTEELSEQASLDFLDSIEKTAENFTDFEEAKKIVSSIPQKYSIPGFVDAMSQFAYMAGNEITKASVAEINRFAGLVDDYRENVTNLTDEVYSLNDDISELNLEVEELNADIKDLNVDIDDLNENIYDLNETIKELETEAEGLNETIAERDNTIEEYKNTVTAKDSEIESKNKEIEGYQNDLNTTRKNLSDMTDAKKYVDKIYANLEDYFEAKCTPVNCDGIVMELPTKENPTFKLYAAKNSRNKIPAGQKIPAMIMRKKNSKVVKGTMFIQNDYYYFTLEKPDQFKKVKDGDWFTLTIPK